MTTSPVILIETWIGDADDVAIVSESVTLNGDDEVIDYDFCVHVFYEVKHWGQEEKKKLLTDFLHNLKNPQIKMHSRTTDVQCRFA